jgi:cysteine synthase
MQVSSDEAIAMARRLALEEGVLTGAPSACGWLRPGGSR